MISLESDIEFYDVKDGFLNKFKPDDFSQVNKQAKQFVMDKIPESSLMGTARKEALETLQIIPRIDRNHWLEIRYFHY